jgi:hypothetical protein
MNIEPEHSHQPHKIGHRWFDIGMTLAILIVSVSSLVVAIVHSETLERMADANAKLVETNSWPFLAYGTANDDEISMTIRNDGVGPAKIESAELTWNGIPQPDGVAFLEACCDAAPKAADINQSLVAGRVLRPGETITFFKVPSKVVDTSAWKKLLLARLSRDLSVNVCYCSVFDECWTDDIVRFSLQPRPVDRCTTPKVPYSYRQ